MNICISADCPKYSYCKRAMGEIGKIEACVDLAHTGSGSASSEGIINEDYTCGPNGDYKMFEPIDQVAVEQPIIAREPAELSNPVAAADTSAEEATQPSTLVIQCDEIVLVKSGLRLAIDAKLDPPLAQFKFIEINGIRFRKES